MVPGEYVAKYTTAGGEQKLALRYEAIKASLQADVDGAPEFARKLGEIG